MNVYLLNPPYFPHFGRGARWQKSALQIEIIIMKREGDKLGED